MKITNKKAFLFYPDDFLMGTISLSFEDRGKYITILSYMHQKGKIKEDSIRALVGSLSEQLKQKFIIDADGYWRNARLECETHKREKFIHSRRLNGSHGGRPVKNDNALEAVPLLQGPLQIVFQKWVEYRKSIRKPLKAQSLEGAFKRLNILSGGDLEKAEAIVSFSIDNGYQGLFPHREDNYKQIKTMTEQWLA